jgi:polyphenol oxidase
MLQHLPWTDVSGLRHGFLDARDCAGAGPWDPIVARAGIALPVHTARQVHGVVVVDAPVSPRVGDGRPPGDAVVSAERGLGVGVVTADCVPILLLARERGVVAAVHAGWRGAAGGVIEATLERLRAAFAVGSGDVEACIGPAIGGCCYQVGVEVHDAFVARTGDLTASAWRTDGDRYRVDLRRAVQSLLAAAGVERVDVVGPCTMCGDGWCSYRRDGQNAGRQLSVIGWT